MMTIGRRLSPKKMSDSIHHDRIPETALDWYKLQGRAALATVVDTWGSAPRPTGSQLAIAADGRMAGSVSGGCVEGAVVAEAADVQRMGEPRLLEFGVSDDEAFSVGLACGGRIAVLVEPIEMPLGVPLDLLERLVELRESRQPALYCVNMRTWERHLIGPDDKTDLNLSFSARLASDRSGMEGDWFVSVHNPPLRMMIVGGVHIAQPLTQMARLAGYDTILIDPRSAFATEERFPGETLVTEWPDDAIPTLRPDARTAIVTLTHDAKIDDAAILSSLSTEAFYIGSLGSTRTHAKRCQRLVEAGVGETQMARIKAPVGLNIGARTPAEIALAIMGEVTETLRLHATSHSPLPVRSELT